MPSAVGDITFCMQDKGPHPSPGSVQKSVSRRGSLPFPGRLPRLGFLRGNDDAEEHDKTCAGRLPRPYLRIDSFHHVPPSCSSALW